eukprot:SAG31_NODE_2532_length_5555_cov_2.362170_6_plen_62_part_00
MWNDHRNNANVMGIEGLPVNTVILGWQCVRGGNPGQWQPLTNMAGLASSELQHSSTSSWVP